MNATWGHGYFVSSSYTSDFYRELAPNWLDIAVLLKGFRPPRSDEGAPFHYLELGCGTGLGLCLLAAAYPEGHFVGVDFHPDHILEAKGLASQFGLTNVIFVEADFIDLQHDLLEIHVGSKFAGCYQYVVSHGIMSWVSADVQRALLSIATQSLALGGIFYCSYNTYPGWLSMSSFQHLFQLEKSHSASPDPTPALEATRSKFLGILGAPEKPSPLLMSSPRLYQDLSAIKNLSPIYLAHEYGCEHWRPLRVADFHVMCSEYKLRPISTATLPELFDDLLPDNIKHTILSEGNPLIRQTLLDLATNKSFRRDIFARGCEHLSPSDLEICLAKLRFRRLEGVPLETYIFPTSLGEIHSNTDVCSSIENALSKGAVYLSELQDATGESINDLIHVIALLLHAGRVAIDRGKASRKATQVCNKANGSLLRLHESSGRSYSWLVSPLIGTCVGFSLIDCIARRAIKENLEGDVLVAFVLMGLSSAGVELSSPSKEPISDPKAQQDLVHSIAENLRTFRLPALEALGVFPPDNQ